MELFCDSGEPSITIKLTNEEAHGVSLHPSDLPWSQNSSSLTLKGYAIIQDRQQRIEQDFPVADEFEFNDVQFEPGEEVTGRIELSSVLNLRKYSGDDVLVFWSFDYGAYFGPTKQDRFVRGIIFIPHQTWFGRTCGSVVYDPFEGN